MITNPDARQDPWRESLQQALLVFDEIVIVCGDENDMNLVKSLNSDHLHITYLNWPQPDWCYCELARHLNAGLDYARTLAPDWIFRFDIDTFVHEADRNQLYKELGLAKTRKKAVCLIEKYQFHLADRCYQKGKVPFIINPDSPIIYGKANHQNDLCQPLLADGGTFICPQGHTIPTGTDIPDNLKTKSGGHVWNYDYTLKDEETGYELLYRHDRAHARFWNKSYEGRKFEEITRQTAMDDFINMTKGRVAKATIKKSIAEHPKFMQEVLRNIKSNVFGKNLWNRIPL